MVFLWLVISQVSTWLKNTDVSRALTSFSSDKHIRERDIVFVRCILSTVTWELRCERIRNRLSRVCYDVIHRTNAFT